MSKRALITGSRGFIGRHMLGALNRRGWQIQCIDIADRRLGGDGDMRLLLGGGDAFRESHFDLAIHCAAVVGGRETIDGEPARLMTANAALDAVFFDWALRNRPGRCVYFSSSAVYPVFRQIHGESRSLVETMVVDTLLADQTYGAVKAWGEQLAMNVREAGVPVTIVRPFSGYGPDQDFCYPFPAMVSRALQHESPFEVWGDGTQVRDFVHVSDIVGATLTLAARGIDGPVNIGNGHGYTMDELARLCMTTMGYRAPIKHLGDKPTGVQHRVCNPSLLHEHYTPRVRLGDGVREAVLGRQVPLP